MTSMGDTTEMTEPSKKRFVRGRARGRPAGAPPPAGGGAVYGLGMVGALVYFVLTAETRQEYLLAFPKAMVWPALMVYRLFRYLGA